jgi:hypothetical protein
MTSLNESSEVFSIGNIDAIDDQRRLLNVLMANCDDFFLITMAIIILLMQAGFGFLEAGSIRAKNTTNILIKNYADLCTGT